MTKRHSKNKQLIIIGGGASGLAASCIAAKYNIDTLLIEKNAKLARKLLASGNGRCNLLNAGEPIYFGDEEFAESALNNCSFERLVDFFASLGLVLKQEEGGRIYPATGRADTVLDCLMRPLKNSSVNINLNERAVSIEPLNEGFKLITEKAEYTCDNLILAGGSIASPKLGGTSDMYNMLMPLGFNLIQPKPALCGIDCDMKPYVTLDGTRLIALCTLVCDGTPTAASIGEVLFSKRGLSGVCIMQLARFLPENTENCHIYLDFSPTLGIDCCNKSKATAINMPCDMGLVNPSDVYKNTDKALDFLKTRLAILNKVDILLGALPSRLSRICAKNSLKETAKAITALKFSGLSPEALNTLRWQRAAYPQKT